MKKLSALYTVLLFCACRQLPSATETGLAPSIFPDCTGITIPSNIAPINFIIDDKADSYVTAVKSGSCQTVIKGNEVRISSAKWKKLISQGDMEVTVYEKKDGKWLSMKPFSMYVTSDEIDRYVSYRIIPHSFESYQRLSINQRDLTSFKEKVIYANDMVQDDGNRQCINCHYFKDWKTDNMQFHARQYLGGTILYTDGKLKKLNMNTDSTLAAAVYPSWHPTHDYIAYSTNRTYQDMHMRDPNRIEAMDEVSDLLLFNIKDMAISVIENDSTMLECHPAWSHDGRTLYYTAAYNPTYSKPKRIFVEARNIRYNLYSKPFDPDTRTWGKTRMEFDAAASDSSLTWPKISPDGRYMLCCISTHGVFPPYQDVSDLIMFDLEKGTRRYVSELNSDQAESYHSWSSTGKWVAISTHREDGTYTRLYFAHHNGDGTFGKPFAMPQRDPQSNRKFMYAYNLPEFTIEPVRLRAREIASFIRKSSPIQVSYESKRTEQP